MVVETMQAMPMSPRQSPAEIGSAAVQWACTRRGRMLVLTVVFFTIILGLGGMHNREAISSRYNALQWRPYIPHIPARIQSPFKIPSNTTLRLENGELATVPQQLKKTTPNFHLVMRAERDTDAFCKSTLSGMILNYPPPTVVNLYRKFEDDLQWERDTLLSVRHYLENVKYVQDEDLVLIVDGEDSWFQLPSDVIIKQYARVVEDANARLLNEYGINEKGYQRYNQTIVFGAEKMCEDDDMACKYTPKSILPANLYGKDEGFDIADRPARYLNSRMLMGPAKDLKVLYQVALGKLDLKQNQKQTIQSVFTTMFGEQQLRRDAVKKRQQESNKPATTRLKDFFAGKKVDKVKIHKVNSAHARKFEFSIGLDYTHALFQPLAYSNEDELIPLMHKNTTDLSALLHPTSWTEDLTLPPSLAQSNPPFWRYELKNDDPSPNEKAAYIDKLAIDKKLDDLPGRKTAWSNVPLVQNTYTGSVPAILLNDPLAESRIIDANGPPTANLTFSNLWLSPFKRALLRNYLRTPQSAIGYHNSLVGGDRMWDTRGGRGGVWTETEDIWLAWGEVDGVCGSLSQLQTAFDDGKGVWLHETESDSENKRIAEQTNADLKGLGLSGMREGKKAKEDKEKEEEMERQREKNLEEQREREHLERLKKEQEEREKKEEDDRDEEQRQKQEAEAKMKEIEEEEERERQKEKNREDMREMEELDRMVMEGGEEK